MGTIPVGNIAVLNIGYLWWMARIPLGVINVISPENSWWMAAIPLANILNIENKAFVVDG